MNGAGEKKINEMTDGELVSMLLSAEGDFLTDETQSIDIAYWYENS